MPLINKILLFYLIHLSISTLAISNQSQKSTNETDLEALLAFKSMITQDSQNSLKSWNKSLNFCQWEGVTCDPQLKRVTTLNLRAKGLIGTLSPYIGNLSYLAELRLSNNSLSGHIPPEIGRLTRLQNLILVNNAFEGEIPASISKCLELIMLRLGTNKLVGNIPHELGLLTKLQWLGLDYNNLTGDMSSLANLTSLQQLLLSGQTYQGIGFQGKLPDFIGTFNNLTVLALGGNSFTGTIPSSYYNLSSLQVLSLNMNQLEGTLPPNLGSYFPQLQWLQIGFNQLTGQIPVSLSNLSSLQVLDISNNSFTGKFSLDATNMHNLSTLNINDNHLGTGQPDDLEFFDTLVNCNDLQILNMINNFFGGNLPHSIANLSTNIQGLFLSNNQIKGTIPTGFGNLVNLQILTLDRNQLIGTIPIDIGNIPALQQLLLSNNQLFGNVPSSLGNLSFLSQLSLSHNKLQGTIPPSLGNCKSLLSLDLSNNNLVGIVPRQLFRPSGIVEIHLDHNMLQGSLPSEIGSVRNLEVLAMSNNNFSGEIPSSLSQCVALTDLHLDSNSFTGSIPPSFILLKDLHVVDLSHNHLSGQVPNFFSELRSLVSLNLSYNNFEGEVPTKGVFTNVSGISLTGNDNLCGGISELHLKKCMSFSLEKGHLSHGRVIAISIASSMFVISIIMSITYLYYTRTRTRKVVNSGSLFKEPFFKVSYDVLLKATNGFSMENLIGVGSFGSVYKATLLRDGTEQVLAVKVMNNLHQQASKSFIAECEALRVIRHRNLVGIITACSSIDFNRNDFKALVYEFMPNGSLGRLLHPRTGDNQLKNLSLVQRLNIAIDVATALDYIHNACGTPIIHCDLKPDNILLDKNLTARVADFGLAKLLPELSVQLQNNCSSAGVRGTVGYAAPEYGLGSSVSAKGDVYSYGVVLLEMMTAKRPTDAMFNGELSLHKLAKSALPEHLVEVIDPRLQLDDGEEPDHDLYVRRAIGEWAMGCVSTIVKIGVQCSSEIPQERMDMKDVISQLQSERQRLRLCRVQVRVRHPPL